MKSLPFIVETGYEAEREPEAFGTPGDGDPEDRYGTKRGLSFSTPSVSSLSSRDIPVDKLRRSWASLQEGLGDLFADVKEVGGFQLRQVSVGLEVSAEGGFKLIGTAKAGGKSSLTLTFEKPKPEPAS